MAELTQSTNPFRPTFGASPLVWAGRHTVLTNFEKSLLGSPGNPDRSIILSGSRGIGKTVLLSEVEDIARRTGWVVLRLSAREGMAQLLTESIIPEALDQLKDTPKRKITGFNVAGIGGVRTKMNEPDIAPRLVSKLRELLDTLDGTGVLITIDEIQDVHADDLTEVAVAFQDLVRDDAPIAIAMAGLTVGINRLLDLPGATFLRRARRYDLGPLTLEDARSNLVETAKNSGKEFFADAADHAAEFTQGYPYLVQLIGYLAWDLADVNITASDVAVARPEAARMLGLHVHQPSIRDVPGRQREFLDAMATLEANSVNGEVMINQIASALGRKINEVSDSRAKLIERDLIIPAGYGKLEFAQPYLGDYLRNEERPIRVQ
ncbi:ATP-binding protein [Corynebacterium sp. P3-F1]|uniref:ATP-binding protein n=1 Tax=Corynebacterium sp. P3-F1 TaxID=3059080 RepID=UPI00265CF9E1|nr:ATP-binding protein [Corynebacterium sp. P3-F1]WKK60981.1 ATP-binding protein [Corynebacterium sp. P3-F1]